MTEILQCHEEVMSQPSGQTPLKTVIVSRPGVSQEALRTGLRAFTWVDIVGSASNGLSALFLIEQKRPNLVVIDSNLLDDELTHLVQHIKKEYPNLYCLALTHTQHQQQAILESGADAALLRDSSAQQLRQALLQFLPKKPAKPAKSTSG